MITGKTKTGFSYEISEARLKNYELVELLADVDTNPLLLPKLVKVMLGEELANKLKDHVRDEEGLVDLEKINQEIIDRNNDRDKDNGDGFVGRVLSMSTGTSLFMSSLTAIVEGMDKAGVSSMEEAEASLKRIDKSATDEDIEDLLKLLSEKVVAFDQLMLDRNIENYESNIRLEEERIAQEQEKENLEKSISLNLLDEINGITF